MATMTVLSSEAEERLNLLASETGHSKEYLLSEVIERGMDDIEDYYLSIEVLERIRAGKERVYSSAEVRRGTLPWTIEYSDRGCQTCRGE